MAKTDLTAHELRAMLHYEPETGVFTRLVQRGGLGRPGSNPSTRNNVGHVVIRVNDYLYLAHRLAWLYVHGEWPQKNIDHINGIRSDNRISNLRDVSQLTNAQNMHGPMSTSSTGFMGVSRNRKRYRATIKLDGKQKFIGNFDTPEEAGAAYLEWKRKHHAGCTI